MEKYHQCIPIEGITNDIGADLNSSENFKFYIDELVSQDNSVPENCVALVKQYLASNQASKRCTIEKKRKLTDSQKAFPLEDETCFWTRLYQNKKSDGQLAMEQTSFNSYISFNVNTSLQNQQEVSYLIT